VINLITRDLLGGARTPEPYCPATWRKIDANSGSLSNSADTGQQQARKQASGAAGRNDLCQTTT
jgi:hypothetical protein